MKKLIWIPILLVMWLASIETTESQSLTPIEIQLKESKEETQLKEKIKIKETQIKTPIKTLDNSKVTSVYSSKPSEKDSGDPYWNSVCPMGRLSYQKLNHQDRLALSYSSLPVKSSKKLIAANGLSMIYGENMLYYSEKQNLWFNIPSQLPLWYTSNLKDYEGLYHSVKNQGENNKKRLYDKENPKNTRSIPLSWISSKSSSLSIVPYGSQFINFSLLDILTSNYTKKVMLGQEYSSSLVISMLKGSSKGNYLLTVSNKKELSNILVKTGTKDTNDTIKESLESLSFEKVHNMIFIQGPINYLMMELGISILYSISMIEQILNASNSIMDNELQTKLNSYEKILEAAINKKMDSKVIENLENKIVSLSEKLSRKVNKVKKVEDLVKNSGKNMVRLDIELVSRMVEITKLETKVNKNYPFTSSMNQFKYNDLTLDEFVKNNFGSLISLEVEMPGILIELSNISLKKATSDQLGNLVNLIENIYHIIQSIGFKEGFINAFDLSDSDIYPLLNLIIPRVLDYEYGLKGEMTSNQRIKAKELIEKRKADPIWYYKELSGKWEAHTHEMFYNSLMNLILVHLYTIIKSCIVIMERNTKVYNYTNYPLLGKCDGLSKLLLGLLTLDIRSYLKYRNPKITKVILSGFDTEYQELDTAQVKPLSAQVASYCELQIEIPKRIRYDPSGIVTNTGQNYLKTVIPNQGIDRQLVIKSIGDSIEKLKDVLYGEKYQVISLIDDVLKKSKMNYVNNTDKKIYIRREPIIRTEFIDLYNREEAWEVESLILEHVVPSCNNELDSKCQELVDLINTNVPNELKEDENKKEKKEGDIEGSNNIEYLNEFEIVSSSNSKLSSIYGSKCSGKALCKLFHMKDCKMNKDSKGSKGLKGTKVLSNYCTLKDLKVRIGHEINILSHYNAADLSLFTNFDKYKKNLKILNKSFATFGKGKKIGGWNVKWRDTILLTSAATSSLKALGGMHNQAKGELTLSEKVSMENLFKKDPERFKNYAIQDSIISIRHGLYILDFVRKNTGGNNIPVTLSGLAKLVIQKDWLEKGYRGYQLDPEYLFDKNYELGTSKGLNAQGKVGLIMPVYLAASRGGRNESMLYGKDIDTTWYDWDLNGCYTTIMGGMGHPVYSKAILLNEDNISEYSDKDLRNSFTSMKVLFKFPEKVAYPVLPVYVDKTSDCYPLEGESNCTGTEYVLAKTLGAELKIITGCYIPFETKELEDGTEKLINQPFKGFVARVQEMRKCYEKGSVSERMWKDIGNMAYGQVFQGLAGRKTLDTVTGTHQYIPSSELTNPIICSWITGKARSIVGESMNKIKKLGGKVVSVTTDGFLTNIKGDLVTKDGHGNDLDKSYESLDRVLLKNSYENENENIKWFKEQRLELGHIPNEAYELKGGVKGILTWRTRGHLCVETLTDYKEKVVSAMTGFQSRGKGVRELNTLVERGLCSDMKMLNFLQFRLRGANDIFKKGGKVTPIYSERKFRVGFDNKRQVEFSNLRKVECSKDVSINVNKYGVSYLDLIGENIMLKTKPWKTAEDCKLARFIMGRMKSPIYQSNDYSYQLLPKMYTKSEIFVRALMRDFINREGKYVSLDGLSRVINDVEFVSYLGEWMKSLGTNIKITTKFGRKWLGYLSGLRLSKGELSPQNIKVYCGSNYLSLASKVFPKNYLNS